MYFSLLCVVIDYSVCYQLSKNKAKLTWSNKRHYKSFKMESYGHTSWGDRRHYSFISYADMYAGFLKCYYIFRFKLKIQQKSVKTYLMSSLLYARLCSYVAIECQPPCLFECSPIPGSLLLHKWHRWSNIIIKFYMHDAIIIR